MIMPEGKLIEIERQIVTGDLMERTHDAALDQGPEAVDVGGMDVAANVLLVLVTDGPVLHAEILLDAPVSAMFVSSNQLDLAGDCLRDESLQGGGVGILDHLRHNITLAGDGSDDRDLSSRATPALAALASSTDTSAVAVLGLPADIGLVNFHDTRQLAELLIPHGGSDSMTHVPRSPVGATSDHTVNLECADSLLAAAHEEDDLEPSPQRIIGVLEDRAHQRRESVALGRTLLALPRPGAGEFMYLLIAATRARDTLGPAHLDKVGPAGIFGRESVHQLSECHHAEKYTTSLGWCQVGHNRHSFPSTTIRIPHMSAIVTSGSLRP